MQPETATKMPLVSIPGSSEGLTYSLTNTLSSMPETAGFKPGSTAQSHSPLIRVEDGGDLMKIMHKYAQDVEAPDDNEQYISELTEFHAQMHLEIAHLRHMVTPSKDEESSDTLLGSAATSSPLTRCFQHQRNKSNILEDLNPYNIIQYE